MVDENLPAAGRQALERSLKARATQALLAPAAATALIAQGGPWNADRLQAILSTRLDLFGVTGTVARPLAGVSSDASGLLSAQATAEDTDIAVDVGAVDLQALAVAYGPEGLDDPAPLVLQAPGTRHSRGWEALAERCLVAGLSDLAAIAFAKATAAMHEERRQR